MNRGQLRFRVAQILGLAATDSESAEEKTLIDDILNEAVIDVLSRTRVNVRTADLALTGEERDYDLSAEMLNVHNLHRGGTELQEWGTGDIGRLGDGAAAYAVLGYNRIRIGWSPSGGDTLRVFYTPRPTPMSADAHDPSDPAYGGIPVEFHSALVNYSCWKLADVAKDTGAARGETYRAAYEGKSGIGEVGSDLGKIKMETNRRALSGSRQRRLRRAEEALSGDIGPNRWIG